MYDGKVLMFYYVFHLSLIMLQLFVQMPLRYRANILKFFRAIKSDFPVPLTMVQCCKHSLTMADSS